MAAKWFAQHGLDFDYILYSNYERQVAGQFAGHYHIAWNSPLAWLQTERIAAKTGRKAEAIAMRDTDCDLTSVIVVRSDSPIGSVEALRGKTVAVVLPIRHRYINPACAFSGNWARARKRLCCASVRCARRQARQSHWW